MVLGALVPLQATVGRRPPHRSIRCHVASLSANVTMFFKFKYKLGPGVTVTRDSVRHPGSSGSDHQVRAKGAAGHDPIIIVW